MLSNRSSDVRVLNRASATQLPNGSWIQWRWAGSGVMRSREFDQPLVVAVARAEHHAVLAERNRPAVAVAGDVANRENGHGGENVRAGLDRAKGTRKQRARNESRNVSMLPAVRNLAGTE